MSDKKDEGETTDLFEVFSAIILGLGAVGAGYAEFNAGQWGGQQLDAFSESNVLTTKAATDHMLNVIYLSSDIQAIASAKEHIMEGFESDSDRTLARELEVATYIYTTGLTQEAYDALKLPKDAYIDETEAEAIVAKGIEEVKSQKEKAAADKAKKPAPPAPTPAPAPAPAPAPDGAAPSGDGTAPAPAPDAAPPAADGAPPPTAPDAAPVADDDKQLIDDVKADLDGAEDEYWVQPSLPVEVLANSLSQELDEEYLQKMMGVGEAAFAKAKARFDEGRVANSNGDKFDLVGLFYTLALFLGGLGLVFKSKVRWVFLVFGSLLIAGSSYFMFTLPFPS